MVAIQENSILDFSVDTSTGFPLITMNLKCKLTHTIFKYIRDVLMEDYLVTLATAGYSTAYIELVDRSPMNVKFCEMLFFEKGQDLGDRLWMKQEILSV